MIQAHIVVVVVVEQKFVVEVISKQLYLVAVSIQGLLI
jgi:hypothetical protein